MPATDSSFPPWCGDGSPRTRRRPARLAGIAEEEKRLLSRDTYLGANQGEKENQHDGDDLRCQQVLYPGKVRQTAAEETAVCGLESAANAKEIRETYRKRFGIETSYRQMNEARIKTCTRDPRLRLLFVGIALVLRNVWVWIHFRFAKGKYSAEPQLFLELLRFKEMLYWITQVIQHALGADKTLGSIAKPTNDSCRITGR